MDSIHIIVEGTGGSINYPRSPGYTYVPNYNSVGYHSYRSIAFRLLSHLVWSQVGHCKERWSELKHSFCSQRRHRAGWLEIEGYACDFDQEVWECRPLLYPLIRSKLTYLEGQERGSWLRPVLRNNSCPLLLNSQSPSRLCNVLGGYHV